MVKSLIEKDKLKKEIETGLQKVYGNKLKKIILYGSYANNTYDEGSDMDIMVLVDLEENEIKELHEQVIDLTVELTSKYGVVLSVIENNYENFYSWMDVVPFYMNVEREGVRLYG